MYLGKQAAGMRIDFSKKEGDAWKLIKTVRADENGRVGEQLMSTETMSVGRYELLFYVEEYYKAAGVKLTDPAYLDTVPARIAIFDAKQSYHVPLYFSPWGILSCRGSCPRHTGEFTWPTQSIAATFWVPASSPQLPL